MSTVCIVCQHYLIRLTCSHWLLIIRLQYLHSKTWKKVGLFTLAATNCAHNVFTRQLSIPSVNMHVTLQALSCANNFQTSLSLEKTLGHWIHHNTQALLQVSLNEQQANNHTTSAQLIHTNTQSTTHRTHTHSRIHVCILLIHQYTLSSSYACILLPRPVESKSPPYQYCLLTSSLLSIP